MLNVGLQQVSTLVLSLLILGCEKTASSSAAVTKALCEPSPGWRLVWADEFEGDTLNTSNWTPQDKASPRNHELEDYDPANVLVRGGNLVLVSKREKRDGMNYTSGLVDSRNKAEFRYGRMCIRAKLPPGKDGIWPAHWMDPVHGGCWPDHGELDIMEMINGDGVLHGTLHWNPDYPVKNCTHKNKACGYQQHSIAMGEYHEFAIEWSSTSLTFYIDGQPYGQCLQTQGSQIPQDDFYFILNTAIGGNWPKSPDNTTVFPQEHLIDYVRVYQQSKDDQKNIEPPNYYDSIKERKSSRLSCADLVQQSDKFLDPKGWYRNGGDYKSVQLDKRHNVNDCVRLCCSDPQCIAFSFNKPQPHTSASCSKGSVCCMLKNTLANLVPNHHGDSVQTGTLLSWKALPGPTPPFPQSSFISHVKFGDEVVSGPSGDTWPFAWADDNQMYGSAGDNHGSKMNVWKASGWPGKDLDIEMLNNDPLDLAELCPSTKNAKPSSLLAIDNVLYMGVSCMNYGDDPSFNRQHNLQGCIAFSNDFGKTWSVKSSTWPFFDSQLAAPEFVQFGMGNHLAKERDFQVYAFFPSSVNGRSYWDNNDVILLGRSQSADTILHHDSWEFFSGFQTHSTKPTWSKSQTEAAPVVTYHNMLGENGVSYNPYIKRYIMANYGFIDSVTGLPKPWHNCSGAGCVRRTQLTLLEAEEPWGPWSVFYRDDDWDSSFPVGQRGHYTPTFPAKWMDEEQRMWMVFSGNPHNYTLLAKQVQLGTAL